MLEDLDVFVDDLSLVIFALLVVDPDDEVCLAIRVSGGRLLVRKLFELDRSKSNSRTSDLLVL
jgi:hypothetical protein